MLTNSLNINVPDIMTPCILRIEDLSVYQDVMPYVCPTVQILVPGYWECITFNDETVPKVEKGFIFNLTACDLGIQTSCCGQEYHALPDGIYVIKYALSPHEHLFAEYNHLRVTALRTSLKKEWCRLKLGACEPSAEIKAKFNALMEISGYIEAAKAEVEYCLNADKGMMLYSHAKKLLSNYSCNIF